MGLLKSFRQTVRAVWPQKFDKTPASQVCKAGDTIKFNLKGTLCPGQTALVTGTAADGSYIKVKLTSELRTGNAQSFPVHYAGHFSVVTQAAQPLPQTSPLELEAQ